VPGLARAGGRSLMALSEALPARILEADGAHWLDVDTPDALKTHMNQGQ